MLSNRVARLAAAAVAAGGIVALGPAAAFAGGIEAGLWKITTVVQTGSMSGPPRQSTKCLTADQVANLAATFSPVANTINSLCKPMQRSFDGTILRWHLVCTGQLDMELIGQFNFDSPHHYTGSVQTKASMAGQPIPESKNTVEGEWLSACPQ